MLMILTVCFIILPWGGIERMESEQHDDIDMWYKNLRIWNGTHVTTVSQRKKF